ncbi:MAG: hypothetical protein R3A13_03490 [Bdellovibrionota bacterium]
MTHFEPTHSQLNGHFACTKQELRDLQEKIAPVIQAFAYSFQSADGVLPVDIIKDLSCLLEKDRKVLLALIKDLAAMPLVEASEADLISIFLVNMRDVLNLEKQVSDGDVFYRLDEAQLSSRDLIIQNLRAEMVLAIGDISRTLPEVLSSRSDKKIHLNLRAYFHRTCSHIRDHLDTGSIICENKDPARKERFVRDLARDVLKFSNERTNMVCRLLGARGGALDLAYVFAGWLQNNLKPISAVKKRAS